MPLPALLRCKLLVGFQLAVAGPAAESLGNQPTKNMEIPSKALLPRQCLLDLSDWVQQKVRYLKIDSAMYLSYTRYVDVSFPTVDRSLLPNVTHTYLLHRVWFLLFSNVPRSNPLTCLELRPLKQWRRHKKRRKHWVEVKERYHKIQSGWKHFENWPLFLRYLSEDFFPGFHILESLNATRFHVYARGVMSARLFCWSFTVHMIFVPGLRLFVFRNVQSLKCLVADGFYLPDTFPDRVTLSTSILKEPCHFFEPKILGEIQPKRDQQNCWKKFEPQKFPLKIPLLRAEVQYSSCGGYAKSDVRCCPSTSLGRNGMLWCPLLVPRVHQTSKWRQWFEREGEACWEVFCFWYTQS